MVSIDYLFFFLYIFCVLLRLSNIRKQHAQTTRQLPSEQGENDDAHQDNPASLADSATDDKSM